MPKFGTKTGGEPLQPLGTTGGAVAGIPNHGATEITTAAETYTLAPPVPGVRKTLYSVGVSSGARTVRLSTPASSAGTVIVGKAATSYHEIVFNSTDVMMVELVGIGTTHWMATSISTGTAIINTTGLVFATS